MALRTVACCLLLVLAGYTTGLPGASDSADPTATATPAPVSVHPGLTADVDVQAFQAPPVRIVATEHPTGRTVVDGTYDGTFTAEFDEGTGSFEANTTYRVVLYVDGEPAWDRVVRHYEGYELRVGENGNVTVESHSMA